jgi:hypothetical protein
LLVSSAKANSGDDGVLSEEEKAQLLDAAQDLLDSSK